MGGPSDATEQLPQRLVERPALVGADHLGRSDALRDDQAGLLESRELAGDRLLWDPGPTGEFGAAERLVPVEDRSQQAHLRVRADKGARGGAAAG